MTAGGPIPAGALRAEQARIARFLETINKHRRALDLAIEEGFEGQLDAAEWRRAFESSEPRDANRTMVVTERLRRALPSLILSATRWLAAHGVEIV